MGLLTPQAMEYLGLLGQSMLGGQSPNAGVNISQAMMFADQDMRKQQALKARLDEERQQAQMRQLAMDKAKREDDFRKALSGGFQPGTASVPFNDAMGDGSGGMIPGQGPSMDFSGAMRVDPMAGFQAQKQWQEMNRKAGPEFKVVGNRLVKIEGGNASEAFSGGPDLPSGMRMGPNGPEWIPEYIKGKKDLAAAGAPRVNVDTKQEDAFSKAYGTKLADTYSGIMEGDVKAATKLNSLSRLESLLKASGPTGKLTPLTLEARKALGSFGIELPEATNFQQAADALSKEMALQLRNPAGGAGMPGAMSDQDREFLRSMIAGIDKTPGANALMIETSRRLAKREREIAKLARDYRKKHGKFDESFNDELAAYAQQNPLFADLAGAVPQGGAAVQQGGSASGATVSNW